MAAITVLLQWAMASVAMAVAPVATNRSGGLATTTAKSGTVSTLATGRADFSEGNVSKAVKDHPVAEVVSLLEGMLATLNQEQLADEEIYDKIGVWCDTNDKAKTTSVAAAEADITRLTAEIESHSASSARLAAEMAALSKEVAENKNALDQATEIRKKQHDEFNAQEKDLVESTTALKAAILVLQKHHQSFLEVPTTHMLGIATMLQEQLRRHAGVFKGALKPSQRRTLEAFVQQFGVQKPNYLDSTPTFKGAYAPQSGEIFGILNQMREEFESDLSEAQQQETTAQSEYEDLKTAKTSEISAGETQLELKTGDKASTDQALVQAKNALVDTKASLAADEKFLMSVKERCQMTDTEWELRQRTRQEEIKAVTKALEILGDSDADATFSRTYGPSFLQFGTIVQSKRRERASQLLAGVAQKVQDPKLSFLLTSVKLDDFTEVKKAIDKMIADLLKEKDDEIKTRDYCTEDLHQNQVMTEHKEREEQDVLAHMNGLSTTIGQLEAEMDTLKSDIENMQTEIASAGTIRHTESQEFQTTVADQQKTQKLLKHAKEQLLLYYGKDARPRSVFTQKQANASQEMPDGFEDYENQGGVSVIGLIEQLITDAEQMEADSTRTEQESQSAYEVFVQDTMEAMAAKGKEIVQKSVSKASAEAAMVQAQGSHDSIVDELERLSNYEAQVHTNCDFILKNFDVRQTARDEEIEALRQAKSILSGASFST